MRVACPVDLTDYIKENAEEAEFISFYDIEEDEILSNERIKTSSSSLSSSSSITTLFLLFFL